MANFVAVIAPLLLLAACAGDDGASCGEVAGCGGELTGVWKVASLCGKISSTGSALHYPFGVGMPADCPTAALGPLHTVSREPIDAQIEFDANGRYVQSGTVRIVDAYVLTAGCIDAIASATATQSKPTPSGAEARSPDSCDIALTSGLTVLPESLQCFADIQRCRCETGQTVQFNDTGYYRTNDARISVNGNTGSGAYCVQSNTASISWHSSTHDDRIELTRSEQSSNDSSDASIPR